MQQEKRGKVMFELNGLDEATSRMALTNAAKKLSVKTTVIAMRNQIILRILVTYLSL